ncbi:ABC transporter substrate-binding protein [Phytohabitans kaempferiae]|uniref:ABC transporter substrate-binding protein n=1 Tax=Phytohabitans kaempferiae TaxID=1620943 RepID=A0ABV6MA12_9ACTN
MTLLRNRPARVDLGPTAALSRRGLLAGGLGLAGAVILAGCGDGDEPAGSASQAPTEREVRTDKGPVTVPGKASKVVTADYYGAFAVVDLGLVPVGVSGGGYDATGPSYAPKLASVPLIGDWTEPDVEKIAAAGPDLIIRTIDTPDALYQQLSQIAPTVVISFQQLLLPEVATRIGEVLGRTAEAEQLLETYRTRTAEVKRKHAAVLGKYTFTFVQQASDTTFWVMGPKWTDVTVLLDSGVQLAEPAKSQAEPTAEVSMEKIGDLDSAGVLLVPAGPDGKTLDPANEALVGKPLWKQLGAVKANRVFPIVYGAASLGTGLELVTRMDTVLTELSSAS